MVYELGYTMSNCLVDFVSLVPIRLINLFTLPETNQRVLSLVWFHFPGRD